MPAYHYTREAGESGQVLVSEGTPKGRPLSDLETSGQPPLRAAFELGAALADILCIAGEDQAVHGNLDATSVYVDVQGDVSIAGFGVSRAPGPAPEGRADVATADMYGLGIVIHGLLTPDAFDSLPADPDEHDDLVISRVLAIDLRAVQGKRWVEDVRRFLCNILAWHPAERPAALDAANVLASVADEVPGDGLVEWAQSSRAAPMASAAPSLKPMPSNVEILGGPTSLSAPLQRGQVRQAPAAKGESTSFWSREKIAQMLAEEDDEPLPVRPSQPAATSDVFSAPKPMASPFSAPAPAENLAPPRRSSADSAPPPPAIPKPVAAPPIEPTPVVEAPPRPVEPPRPRRVEPMGAPAAPPRPADPPRAQYTPPAQPAVYAPGPSVLDDPPPAAGGNKGLMIGVGVVVLLGLLCAGVVALGGGAWFISGSTPTTPVATSEKSSSEAADTPTETPAEPAAGGSAPAAAPTTKPAAGGSASTGSSASSGSSASAASSSTSGSSVSNGSAASTPPPSTTPPKATAAPKTSTSSSASSSGSTAAPKTTPPPATSTKSTGSTKATPAPVAAAPTTGPYTVRFNVPGKEGRVQCGDGQDAEFVGSTNLSFEGSVTCRITADKKRGAVQLDHGTTVNCSDVGTVLSCGGG